MIVIDAFNEWKLAKLIISEINTFDEEFKKKFLKYLTFINFQILIIG